MSYSKVNDNTRYTVMFIIEEFNSESIYCTLAMQPGP